MNIILEILVIVVLILINGFLATPRTEMIWLDLEDPLYISIDKIKADLAVLTVSSGPELHSQNCVHAKDVR
jgi:hypothetical protein